MSNRDLCDARISLYLSSEQKKDIIKKASNEGTSMSEIVKTEGFDELEAERYNTLV